MQIKPICNNSIIVENQRGIKSISENDNRIWIVPIGFSC